MLSSCVFFPFSKLDEKNSLDFLPAPSTSSYWCREFILKHTLRTPRPWNSTFSPVGAWPLKGPSKKPQCLNLKEITGGPEYTFSTSHANPRGKADRKASWDDSKVSSSAL